MSKALLQRQRDDGGMDWRNYAACRDVDPDLFFPLGTVGASLPQIEQAKQVCRTCPVSGTCLRWALDHGDAGVRTVAMKVIDSERYRFIVIAGDAVRAGR